VGLEEGGLGDRGALRDPCLAMSGLEELLGTSVSVGILSFCDARALGSVLNASRISRECRRHDVVWAEALERFVGPRLALPFLTGKVQYPKWEVGMTRVARWVAKRVMWRHPDPGPLASLDLLPPLYLHRAALCTAVGGALVFGGSDLENVFDGLWIFRWAGQSGQGMAPASQVEDAWWRLPHGEQTPEARSASTLVAIAPDRLVLFGGCGDDGSFYADTWELLIAANGGLQFQRKTLAVSPTPRWGHTAVSFNGCMYIVGGTAPGVAFDDVWRYDPIRGWIAVAFPEDSARLAGRGGHSAVVVAGHMYVFGGNNRSHSFGGHWRLDLETIEKELEAAGNLGDHVFETSIEWEALASRGVAPNARIGHAAVAVGSRIFVYGGRDYIRRRFEPCVYVFDTTTGVWDKLEHEGPPPLNRTGHAAIPHEDGIIFLGGLLEDPTTGDAVPANSAVLLDVSSGRGVC